MSRIRIRRMQQQDVVQAAALEAQIFSLPWSEQAFSDALKLTHTVFLVAEEGGRVAGYIGMYLSLEEGEITNVAVAPEFRRRGIADALLTEIKREAAECGVTSLVLEVRVSNQNAIRLYEKHGFVSCGVRKGFYEQPKEDAFLMILGQ